MLVHKDFKRLFDEIAIHDAAEINLTGVPISVRVFDRGTKLSLITSVYEGGNYIPQSVRKCIAQKTPFKFNPHKTFIKIDEDNYRIFLNYLGQLENLNQRKFIDLIEDFSELADQWRQYLDEHDKNDLVHVRVK